jgi:DNA polymerase (family 10)
MVQQSIALGYEYVAITDHSARSAASHNLAIDDVRHQADEIAALRQMYPEIRILHGVEVDILRDGSLDFPERVLRQFDIVLASLHDRASHSAAELLAPLRTRHARPARLYRHPSDEPAGTGACRLRPGR